MCQRSSKRERRFIMRKFLELLFVISMLTACTSAAEPSAPPQLAPTVSFTNTPLPSTPEADPATPAPTESVELPTLPAPAEDFFTQMGISLPAPTCNSVTQSQTEGPYYKPNTPERQSRLEEGMPGTRLILVGYVLDQNCQPLPNAWLDFWQADSNGEYDNT